MTEKLKIVFMGTPEFAVPALENLINKHNVVAVYTKEAKPTGRNMVLTKSPVQITAEKYNIPIYTPKNFKDILDIAKLQLLKADAIVVCAYGVILPDRVLDSPRLGCFNIHASLLPKHRGANPIQRAIIEGDKMAGITIMSMNTGVDTGEMLLKDAMPIPPDMTYGELKDALSIMGGNLIIEYLENMDNILPQRQTRDFTLAPKLSKEETKIDWSKDATAIHNLVRGLSPYPYANFTHKNNVIKVIKTEVLKEKTNAPAGTVLNSNMDIACGNESILRLISVQKSGGKIMDIKSFLNGYKIEKEEVLS